MHPHDAELVAGFLLQEYPAFRDFVERNNIRQESNFEASAIIDCICAESQGRIPTTMKQLFSHDVVFNLEERCIMEVIQAARTIQEFLWSDMNTESGLEEFRRMFRKRLAKIEAISMDNPHWRIELLKRLLQTAAICVNLMTKAVSGRLTHNGIHPTMPSNLPQFDRPIGEI